MADFVCDCWHCADDSDRLAARLAAAKEDPGLMEVFDIACGSRPQKKDIVPLFDFAASEAAEYISLLSCRDNSVDDEIGLKVAELIEKSEVLESVHINGNRLTIAAISAIIKALQVNTSVRDLHLFDNWFCVTPQIEELCTFALWVNPARPEMFKLALYRAEGDEFLLERFQKNAKARGHPPLQMILAVYDRKMTVRGNNRFAPVRRIQ